MHYRMLPEELQLRTRYEERYGKKFIPEGMQVQNFGVTYDEMEPFFDFAEKVFGTSGKAGNLNGRIQAGGNPLEGKRSSEFPTPPLKNTLGAQPFREGRARSRLQSVSPRLPRTPRSRTRTRMACASGHATSAASARTSAATCTRRHRRRPPSCRCCSRSRTSSCARARMSPRCCCRRTARPRPACSTSTRKAANASSPSTWSSSRRSRCITCTCCCCRASASPTIRRVWARSAATTRIK